MDAQQDHGKIYLLKDKFPKNTFNIYMGITNVGCIKYNFHFANKF